MRVSFINDTGAIYEVEVDPQVELENIMALLEAECGIPVAEQVISYNGVELLDPRATLGSVGVQENAMLQLRRKAVIAGRIVGHDEEMMRLQILGDPNLMRQLRETQPEIADAVQNNPQRFTQLLHQHRERQQQATMAHQREIDTLNADPYNIDAQRRIEESIRQQAVLENMEHAMEYSPEFFGRVTMLYIPIEVNGVKVKAFVDMSPDCAESCGLLRLLDTRFAGIAKGVGTAKILGRVHSAQLKLADLHLACAFTIMEGRDVDLLFGLDMLKAHQACIDLEKGVLRIQGREVAFLAEHELPDKARMDTSAELEASDKKATEANPPASGSGSSAPPRPSSGFPGSGNTLGSAPASSPSPAPVPAPVRTPAPAPFPREHIDMLVGLGATEAQAVELLQAAGGNVDVAGALLFQ
ncbi:aspartyl protease [Ceratobasidium sp. AG-Ba]|nr:aspartyl protease [Ceratobasidium sp. AG-Ba]